MIRKPRALLRISVAGGLALSVGACSSSSSPDSTTTTPPVVVVTPQEDKFGTVFGTDYRVTANAEPANVNDTDIVAISLTTEPIDVS